MPTFEPIGVMHSPYAEKRDAPRQGTLGAAGTIELFPRTGMSDALRDLEGFERIIILFHFHEATHFSPTVQPPRSSKKRGLFATRSPHRPNPIGFTVAKLVAVRGLTLEVSGIDLIEGTPILDLKPYVPYADAFPTSKAGWLEEEGATQNAPREAHEAARDPIAQHVVTFSEESTRALAWLREHGRDIEAQLREALALGTHPHAYRRIKKRGDAWEIALKDLRASFTSEGKSVHVARIFSGYSAKDLATKEDLELHRAFVRALGHGARR